MSITLSDHQWENTHKAAAWYREADMNRYKFEFPETLNSFTGETARQTGLGKGQDFFFGGYAGTGKTTVLPAVIEECGLTPEDVAFCAPTGKAAKVMGEKLRAFGMNVIPTTIHKLIYLPKTERAAVIKARISEMTDKIVSARANGTDVVWWERDVMRQGSVRDAEAHMLKLNDDLIRAMDSTDGPKFHLRPREDIDEKIKLFVVDEGSMVGATIAADLASYGIPILAFGDPGQLPPVQDVYGFNCENPDAFLTEIHRQAADNPIIQLATRARQQLELKLGDYGQGVRVIRRRDDTGTYDMDREAMVLVGTHKKKWGVTKRIRKEAGYLSTGPLEGEPLLVCKNSQKHSTLVNGAFVENLTEHGDLVDGCASFMLRVMEEGSSNTSPIELMAVQGLFEEHHMRRRNAYSAHSHAAFDAKKKCEHLDWGHAITVHKSQGSQWDDVILHDESDVFQESKWQWLYTGITRSAGTLDVVV